MTLVGAGPGMADEAGSGTRVRVFAPAVSEDPIVGQLVSSDDDTLVIMRERRSVLGWPFAKTDTMALTLPRQSVTRLERSVRPSRKKLGAIIGGAIGVVVGAAIIERSTTTDEPCTGCGAVAAVIGSPVAALGWLIAPGERWARDDPGRVRVGLTGAPGRGRGIGLAVTF